MVITMDERLDNLEEHSDSPSEVASTWNSSHEALLASIADRANCYRWLHNHCQLTYEKYNFYLSIPSIVLSSLTGSATIGLTGIFPDSYQKAASIGIGILTLTGGALMSINQYMKTSQLAESHRTLSIAYGKLHRIISAELTLRRDQRVHAQDFIRLVRTEQDRLQEGSPTILSSVVSKFRKEFAGRDDLQKPELVGDLDHVQVNRARKDDPTPTAPLLGRRLTGYYMPSNNRVAPYEPTPSTEKHVHYSQQERVEIPLEGIKVES